MLVDGILAKLKTQGTNQIKFSQRCFLSHFLDIITPIFVQVVIFLVSVFIISNVLDDLTALIDGLMCHSATLTTV